MTGRYNKAFLGLDLSSTYDWAAMATVDTLPRTLAELQDSGWESKTVKQEMRDNVVRMLANGEELFPGIVGYEDTVIPEINIALLAGHDMLFLGEKGQAKSRLMRLLTRFLDEYIPYVDIPGLPVHEDPYRPITQAGKRFLAEHRPEEVPIAWWSREERYAERLSPGTKFADIIGEIDPAKLVGGTSMGAEEALHFGLIPRMHRGVFAMNELPELDELVQVGLFNILEERDVQIRGYPIRFDLDVVILFSANPSTYNRSGKVIPQLKDRIGSIIQTHYPKDRSIGIEILQQEAGIDLDGDYPVVVPYFMAEIIEEITAQARRSKYIDQASGVSARFSLANYRAMIASARQRAIVLGEKPAVPRISDLGHLYASSLGKLELDLMGSHQMSERQVLDALIAEAIKVVFQQYVDTYGLEEIAEIFGKGVRIEVGDMLPSAAYADRLKAVPPLWEKAFEVNAAQSAPVRASCVEFVLAGLYALDQISRAQRHGKITYET
ncbi:MAG: magnesium protoporphyrin chelatase [Pirellulaceae bacterium]|nr:MAG: magnesium protoporphyrin chelatase [Pirellulaceae bacterium]